MISPWHLWLLIFQTFISLKANLLYPLLCSTQSVYLSPWSTSDRVLGLLSGSIPSWGLRASFSVDSSTIHIGHRECSQLEHVPSYLTPAFPLHAQHRTSNIIRGFFSTLLPFSLAYSSVLRLAPAICFISAIIWLIFHSPSSTASVTFFRLCPLSHTASLLTRLRSPFVGISSSDISAESLLLGQIPGLIILALWQFLGDSPTVLALKIEPGILDGGAWILGYERAREGRIYGCEPRIYIACLIEAMELSSHLNRTPLI